MRENLFVSRTAEVKSLITEFMEQTDEAVERKDIVNYVQAHVVEKVTDGVIAGAIKVMTADGEIFPVSRGVYVRCAGKRQTTVFERIYSVCKRFQGDLNRACTVNVLELNSEERYTYLKIIDVLDRLTGQVNSCVDDMELLVRMWVNPDGTPLGLPELSMEDTEPEWGFDSYDSLARALGLDSLGCMESYENEGEPVEMGADASDDSGFQWDNIDEVIAREGNTLENADNTLENEEDTLEGVNESVEEPEGSLENENDILASEEDTSKAVDESVEKKDDAVAKKPVARKRGRKSKKSEESI